LKKVNTTESKNLSANKAGQSTTDRRIDNLVPAKDKNPDDMEIID
jgi:hypothetical protein